MKGLIVEAGDRVHEARGLPAVMDAACDAFEAILALIGGYEDGTGELVAPLLLAATQAANGRDALLFAPSLPPHSRHPPQPGHQQQGGSAGDLSTAVTSLSRLLAARLARTATVTAGADRAACHDAARYATQIQDLLAGADR